MKMNLDAGPRRNSRRLPTTKSTPTHPAHTPTLSTAPSHSARAHPYTIHSTLPLRPRTPLHYPQHPPTPPAHTQPVLLPLLPHLHTTPPTAPPERAPGPPTASSRAPILPVPSELFPTPPSYPPGSTACPAGTSRTGSARPAGSWTGRCLEGEKCLLHPFQFRLRIRQARQDRLVRREQARPGLLGVGRGRAWREKKAAVRYVVSFYGRA